jgi:hypothetical protein
MHPAIAFLEFSTWVGWNISMKVMLIPLAIAAMFFRTGMRD